MLIRGDLEFGVKLHQDMNYLFYDTLRFSLGLNAQIRQEVIYADIWKFDLDQKTESTLPQFNDL